MKRLDLISTLSTGTATWVDVDIDWDKPLPPLPRVHVTQKVKSSLIQFSGSGSHTTLASGYFFRPRLASARRFVMRSGIRFDLKRFPTARNGTL